jgi:hypothetical protein
LIDGEAFDIVDPTAGGSDGEGLYSARPGSNGVAMPFKGGIVKKLAWMVVLLGLAATGCAPKETAYMKNPATGEVAACGPYYRELEIQIAAKQWCVDDYARRGYVPATGQ